MRERDHHGPLVFVPAADALADAAHTQQAACGETADGDDQLGAQQAQLVVAPALAQALLERESLKGSEARDVLLCAPPVMPA